MPVELLSVLPIVFPDLQLPLKATYSQEEEDKASFKDVKQDPGSDSKIILPVAFECLLVHQLYPG